MNVVCVSRNYVYACWLFGDFSRKCEDIILDDAPYFFWSKFIFVTRFAISRRLTKTRLSRYSTTACTFLRNMLVQQEQCTLLFGRSPLLFSASWWLSLVLGAIPHSVHNRLTSRLDQDQLTIHCHPPPTLYKRCSQLDDLQELYFRRQRKRYTFIRQANVR